MEQVRGQESEIWRLAQEKERFKSLLHAVIHLGAALLAEENFDRLLETIVVEAMSFCNADAGSLYLRNSDDTLSFVIMRCHSLHLAKGGTTGEKIPFSPLPMYDPATGGANRYNVVSQAALSGIAINVADAYNAPGFDFSGTRAFDRVTGYRSTSFLTVPLVDRSRRVIGVLQLINALCPETGRIIPFDRDMESILGSLALLAAGALETYIREQDLRQQVLALRIEIDQSRKVREVAEITETDYFRNLQEKARGLRRAASGG
jgi:GAF domain-containing protein